MHSSVSFRFAQGQEMIVHAIWTVDTICARKGYDLTRGEEYGPLLPGNLGRKFMQTRKLELG